MKTRVMAAKKCFFSHYKNKFIFLCINIENSHYLTISQFWKCSLGWHKRLVTHTRNSCSVFNPSKVHTHSSEHTHCEHTPGAVGSHLCCSALGAVGGSVPCSRAPQSWYWRWRKRALVIHYPHLYNSSQTWDSNSQPLDHESDTLTIGPRLPQINFFQK